MVGPFVIEELTIPIISDGKTFLSGQSFPIIEQ